MCGVVAPVAYLLLINRASVINVINDIHVLIISGAALLSTRKNVTAVEPRYRTGNLGRGTQMHIWWHQC